MKNLDDTRLPARSAVRQNHVLSTRYANNKGVTPIAQMSIAILRAALTVLPRFNLRTDNQPAATLPTSESK